MSNEFKEVTSMEEVEKALKEMRRAWEDICEAFHVDAPDQAAAGGYPE